MSLAPASEMACPTSAWRLRVCVVKTVPSDLDNLSLFNSSTASTFPSDPPDVVNKMTEPRTPVLAPSRSKKEFFERLGLSEENAWHRQLYTRMKVRQLDNVQSVIETIETGRSHRRSTANNSRSSKLRSQGQFSNTLFCEPNHRDGISSTNHHHLPNGFASYESRI